jgi:hemoglobin/transferrin/lactoferrin receptor protein
MKSASIRARLAALIAGAGALAVVSGGARAQEAPAEAAQPGDAGVSHLPPVTATALRLVRSLFETPANVSVITRPEIERRMYQTIEDMIRYEPGISVARQTSRTDPFSSLGGFTIRGVSTNRVLTIIDGTRVIERITDQTRDLVDLGHIKRVEIVRGPASALWGSDALGGVVAFTTKDPADYLKASGNDHAFQTDFTYNSFDHAFTEIGTAAVRRGPFEALLSYTRRDANEGTLSNARNGTANGGEWACPRAPESLPCNKLDPADIRSNNILAKVVYNLEPGHFLKLTGEYFARNTRVDQLWDHGRGVNTNGTLSTTTETLDYKRTQELERYRISLEHSWQTNLSFLDALRWQLTYHPQRLDRTGDRYQRSLTTGVVTYRRDVLEYSEDFFEGDIQLRSSAQLGPTQHQFIYGGYASVAKTRYNRIDFTRNLSTGVTTTAFSGFNFADADTTRADFYIQDEIAMFDRRLLLTPALRYATYRISPKARQGYVTVPGKEPRELYEDDLALKFGGVFKVTPNFALYAQYSEGFKMPTAEQLFTSVPSAFGSVLPNPELMPESVKSYEIGLRGQFKDVFFSTNFFYARYKNFIQSFVSVPGTIDVTYQNVARVNVWGFEGSGAWRFHPNFELNGAFVWQRATQKESDAALLEPFNGIEPYRLVAGLRWRKPEWGIDAEVIGTYFGEVNASQTDDTPRERFRPDGAFVLDATLAWSPRPWITLRASVLNIFDKRYFPSSVSSTHASFPDTAAVAATNNLELQTAPGRTFRVGLTMKF